MGNSIEAWYDGACEPFNPGGHAAWGAVVRRNDEVLWEASGYVGSGPRMSNNVAEYTGAIAILKFLKQNGLQKRPVVIRGDNQMSIMQMAGKWKAKGGLYLPYYHKAMALIAEFPNIDFVWIPRAMNGRADELSKEILVTQGIRLVH